MPIYNTTSVEPTIAKIIRDTRLQDMSYANDLIEWIGEAVDFMRINYRLPKAYKVVTVKNHIVELPCGIATLDAVWYNGGRLRRGTSTIDPRFKAWKEVKDTDLGTYFYTDTNIKPEDVNQVNSILYRGDTIKQDTADDSSTAFYLLEYNTIKTSFKSGTIVLFYKVRNLGPDGYPLIPDVAEAREAILWYVCSKLLFTGYKLPIDIDFKACESRASMYFRRTKNIIKEPDQDEKEAALQLLNNLIPPQHYYETFFTGGEQRKFVNK